MVKPVSTSYGEAPVRRRDLSAVRMVEQQQFLSLRKHVPSSAALKRLEELIDEVKPPRRDDCAGVTRLVQSAFRHPPLPHGSRFGGSQEPGIWYGALDTMAMLHEIAYYSFFILDESPAVTPGYALEKVSYQIEIGSKRHVDLTKPPFAGPQEHLRHPSDYSCAQQVGRELREAGVQTIQYASARDPEARLNTAVFDCNVIWKGDIVHRPWHLWVDLESVDFEQVDTGKVITIPRAVFLVAGRLPRPSA